MSENRKLYKNTKHRIKLLFDSGELEKLKAIKKYVISKIYELEKISNKKQDNNKPKQRSRHENTK